MPNLNYEVIWRKVEDKYPEIARQLIWTPILSDSRLIGELYQWFNNNVNDPVKRIDRDVLFIGVILYLYDRDSLLGFKLNLFNGLNKELSNVMGYERTRISTRVKAAKGFYEVYPKFRDQVKEIAKGFITLVL